MASQDLPQQSFLCIIFWFRVRNSGFKIMMFPRRHINQEKFIGFSHFSWVLISFILERLRISAFFLQYNKYLCPLMRHKGRGPSQFRPMVHTVAEEISCSMRLSCCLLSTTLLWPKTVHFTIHCAKFHLTSLMQAIAILSTQNQSPS